MRLVREIKQIKLVADDDRVSVNSQTDVFKSVK